MWLAFQKLENFLVEFYEKNVICNILIWLIRDEGFPNPYIVYG